MTIVGTATIRIMPDTAGFSAALQGQLKGVSGAMGKAFGTGPISNFHANLRGLDETIGRASRRMMYMGQAMTYGITRPLVSLAGASVSAAAEFDSALRTIAAVGDLDIIGGFEGFEGDLGRIEERAKELGRTTKFSAVEVAQGFTDLARAGLPVESQLGAIREVVKLATVENIDMADATDRLINVYTGFGFKLEDVNKQVDLGGQKVGQLQAVTDVLAKVSAATTADMVSLTDAFRYAGPVAAAAGANFEEVAAALGVLDQAGFKATVGGTSLRGVFTRLAVPTKVNQETFDKLRLSVDGAIGAADPQEFEAFSKSLQKMGKSSKEISDAWGVQSVESLQAFRDELGRVGIKQEEIFDQTGQARPLGEIVAIFADRYEEGLFKVGDAMKLFGQRAGPGFLALLQNEMLLQNVTQEAGHAAGASEDMAKIIEESAVVQFQMLKNSLVDLSIAIGQSGALRFFVEMSQSIAEFAQGIAKSNPEIFRWVFLVGALVAALGPLQIIISLVGRGIQGFLIKPLLLLLNPVALVGAAIGALVGFFGLMLARSQKLRDAVSKLGQAFGKILGPVFERLKGWFEGAVGASDDFITQLADNLAPKIEEIANRIAEFANSKEFNDFLNGLGEAASLAADIWRNVLLPILKEVWDFINSYLVPVVGVVLYGAWETLNFIVGLVVDALKTFSSDGNSVMAFIRDNFTPIVIGLGTAFAYVKIQAALAAGSTGIGALTAAFPRLLGFLAIGPRLVAVWGSLGSTFKLMSMGFSGFLPGLSGVSGALTAIGGTAAGVAITFTAIAAAVISVGVLIKMVYDRSAEFVAAVQAGWEQIRLIGEGIAETFSGLWDIVAGIFTADGERILDGVGAFFQGLVSKVIGGLAGLLAEVSRGLGAFLDTILEAFGNIPVLGPIFDFLRGITGALTGTLGGLLDMLQGLLSLDFDKVKDGLGKIGEALSNAGGIILGALGDIGSGLLAGLGNIGEFLGGIFDKVEEIAPQVGRALLDIFVAALRWVFNELPRHVGEFLSALPGVITQIGNSLADGIRAAPEFISKIPEALGGALTAAFSHIGDFLGNVWDFIKKAIFGGGEADGAGQAIGDAIAPSPEQSQGLAQRIGDFLVEAFSNAVSFLIENIPRLFTQVIPAVVGFLIELPGKILSGAGNLGSRLLDAFADFAPGLLDFFANLPSRLGDIGGAILGAIGNIGGALWDVILPALQGLASNIWNFLFEMVTSTPRALLNLGAHLLGAFVVAARYVRDHWQEIIGGILHFFQELPVKIVMAIGSLGSWLWEHAFGPAWEFIKTNFPIGLETLLNFFRELPGKIVGAIGDLGSRLWNEAFLPAGNFLRENFPIWIEGVRTFFSELPGKIVGAIGDLGSWLWNNVFIPAGMFLATNIPIWIENAKAFFAELPGRIVGAIGDLGSRLWNDVFVPAWNWLRENIPNIISSIVGFFAELPGKIVSAIGSMGSAAFDFAKTLGNAFIDFVNASIISRINEFSIDLPIAGRVDFPDLPFIPKAHDGGIVGVGGKTGKVNSNEVLRILEIGEAVIPKDVVDKLGADFIGQLISGSLPAALINLTLTVQIAFIGMAEAAGAFSVLSEHIKTLMGDAANVVTLTFQNMFGAITIRLLLFQSQFAITAITITSYVGMIRAALMGIPATMDAVSRAIANGFRNPIAFIGTSIWPPFATMLNSAAAAFGIPVNLPTGFRVPTYHTGGVVGEGGTMTDASRMATDEIVAKLQRGEGVMSREMMASMSPAQLHEFRRGNPFWYAVGGPYESGNAWVTERADQVGSSINRYDLEAMKANYEAVIAPMIDSIKNTLQGNISGSAMETIALGVMEFVRGANEAVSAEMTRRIPGLPADFNIQGVIPDGFDLGAWREFLAANKAPGDWPLLPRYLDALGVPYLLNSTFRPGDGTSYHASGRAVDFGAPGDANYDSPGLLRINHALAPLLGVLSELIYAGPGGISDKSYDGATMAAHHNHVHAALANGALVEELMLAILGEDGPEVVLPLNRPGRALDLAIQSGLFGVLEEAARARNINFSGSPVRTFAGSSTSRTSSTTSASGGGFDGGILGGGPGNTYHLHGAELPQVRAEIRNRDEATMRKRRS